MTHCLIFTFAATFASFGTVAVGERRPTWDRPSKSQTIGLLAAALGIERNDAEAQIKLADGLKFAVRIDDPGTLATDYHTAEVPPARKNQSFATRRAELSVPKHERRTILSRREYRAGSRYTIAVWYRPDNPTALYELASALHEPVFTPYAGRKAFPLMLPTFPQVIPVGDSIEEVFQAYDELLPSDVIDHVKQHSRSRPQMPARIFADADVVPKQLVDTLEERRDIPESRAKWRFGLRSEASIRTASPAEAESND